MLHDLGQVGLGHFAAGVDDQQFRSDGRFQPLLDKLPANCLELAGWNFVGIGRQKFVDVAHDFAGQDHFVADADHDLGAVECDGGRTGGVAGFGPSGLFPRAEQAGALALGELRASRRRNCRRIHSRITGSRGRQ